MFSTLYLILVYIALAILVFTPIGWVFKDLRNKGVLQRERGRFRRIFGDDALLLLFPLPRQQSQ